MERRIHRLHLRLTTTERAQLTERARAVGLKPTAYVQQEVRHRLQTGGIVASARLWFIRETLAEHATRKASLRRELARITELVQTYRGSPAAPLIPFLEEREHSVASELDALELADQRLEQEAHAIQNPPENPS